MRKRKTEHISEAIHDFLKQGKLEDPFYERRLVEAWPLVLGDQIMRYTAEIYIKKKILYVKLNSAVLRNDLFINREQIVISLNNHVGKEVIKELIFC